MTFPQPLLVFGPRKSGTTLLHNLLDGGSELLMIPSELRLHRFQRKIDSSPQDFARHYLDEGRLYFNQMLVWQNEELQANADFAFDGLSREQTRAVFDLEGYVSQLRQALACPPASPRQMVDFDVKAFLNSVKRLPPHLKILASKEIGTHPETTLQFWQELYPDGRIVYLVRQPEFIVRSILNDRRRKGRRLSMRKIWRYCIEAQHLINFAYQTSQWSPEKRPIFLSYEAMTSSPETEMRRVARELGIAFEPILAKPTTLGLSMVVRTSSRATTEVFQQAPSWKNGLTQRELRVMQTYDLFKTHVFRKHHEKLISYDTLQVRLQELAAG